MKISTLLLFILLIISLKSFAQLGIKTTNSAPNSKAMLDVESPNKGILIPRMSSFTRDGITSPPDGLLIYNNQTKKFNYFNNTIWQDALFGDLWERNGTNISYSTGFVGIGFPTPARNLVINSGGSPDILIQQSAFSGNTANDGFMLGTNTNLDGEIWNFENARIRFGTSNAERISILSGGNVGINHMLPSEKLEISGNIKASGNILLSNTSEVNRTTTGTANMIPIAYGNVSDQGGYMLGTGNFQIAKPSLGNYDIILDDESITSPANYIFSATSISTTVQFCTVRINNGALRVETFDLSGVNADGSFSFIIYKP